VNSVGVYGETGVGVLGSRDALDAQLSDAEVVVGVDVDDDSTPFGEVALPVARSPTSPLTWKIGGALPLHDALAVLALITSAPWSSPSFFDILRPAEGGRFANSCCPGTGGGRKEDPGEGKGWEELGVSKARWSVLCTEVMDEIYRPYVVGCLSPCLVRHKDRL
jgi:hypothetical protein